ncbi:class Ib ribonucleoside-diphosphate reductase assembly flavoprotein NrdI [Weissella kandleri]|uniref:class Ib ribonucleoside-diphosphate reductase assembly flavoprotein NrdI n=1 Tax=Weissella kandleri TaxID=1616 RepID=UPI00387E64D9
MQIKLLYISVAGNTKSFINNLVAFSQSQADNLELIPTELTTSAEKLQLTLPTIIFVPTYLDGGNGIDQGVREIMTTDLYDTLTDLPNFDNIIGIIGSGNKNFNAQYLLTARRYSLAFNAPLIDNYELRGTQTDIKRVYQTIFTLANHNTVKTKQPVQQIYRSFNAQQQPTYLLVNHEVKWVSPLLKQLPNPQNVPTITALDQLNQLYSKQISFLGNQHYQMHLASEFG